MGSGVGVGDRPCQAVVALALVILFSNSIGVKQSSPTFLRKLSGSLTFFHERS